MPIDIVALIKTLLGLANPELIGQVLKALFPDLATQIDGEIIKVRKERDGKKQEFKKALEEMDIAALNRLFDELMG